MIALLPVLLGAVKVTVASPFAVVAETAVGAPGTATITASATLALAELLLAVSVGVNVAVKVCVPTFGVVPLAGLYTKEPATLAVALSCVAESAVP